MKIKSNSLNANATVIPLLSLGFRPFFLVAAIFAVFSIALWSAVYFGKIRIPLEGISILQWHAHEMLYGYSMAVIAGFLLTAVKNWTSVQTLYGAALGLLVGLWLLARVFFAVGMISFAAIFDLCFILALSIAIFLPIAKVKQWKQMAVVSKLFLLAAFNVYFYLGAFGIASNGVEIGLYAGLYLIVGLVLMIGRRVIPFFIERGVDQKVSLFNSVWLDRASLALFLIFFVAVLMPHSELLATYTSLFLFCVNGVRLLGWHTPHLWTKPLLWSLYLSLWFLCCGFLFYAGTYFFGWSKFIAIHAFAYGGIGSITLSMMSRVSLGHTGRDIHHPPATIKWAYIALLLGAFVRVVLPLMFASHYLLWVGLSQAFWILSFILFIVVYYPILTKARIDGLPD